MGVLETYLGFKNLGLESPLSSLAKYMMRIEIDATICKDSVSREIIFIPATNPKEHIYYLARIILGVSFLMMQRIFKIINILAKQTTTLNII